MLTAVFEGEEVGTKFLPQPNKKSSREQWMVQHLKPHGELHLDDGAFKAVIESHASLIECGSKPCRGAV